MIPWPATAPDNCKSWLVWSHTAVPAGRRQLDGRAGPQCGATGASGTQPFACGAPGHWFAKQLLRAPCGACSAPWLAVQPTEGTPRPHTHGRQRAARASSRASGVAEWHGGCKGGRPEARGVGHPRQSRWLPPQPAGAPCKSSLITHAFHHSAGLAGPKTNPAAASQPSRPTAQVQQHVAEGQQPLPPPGCMLRHRRRQRRWPPPPPRSSGSTGASRGP